MQGSAWGLGVRGYPPSLPLSLTPSFSSLPPSIAPSLPLSRLISLPLSLSFSFFPSSVFSSTISRPCSSYFHKTWWLMPSKRGSLQIATECCFVLFFFVLKLSSTITEPAGLLPTQQDKQSRAWKMKAKPTKGKET